MNRVKVELDSIFCAAMELASPAARAAYLDRVCGDDPEARRRVERLLAAHSQAGNFLGPRPTAAASATDLPAQAIGTMIGPYKLLQEIGEGGMGTVFMAEQTQPMRRKVALKVIKPGMDSRQVIARFEAERQALAMMDHVNIAKVFDAGAAEAGLPYFVMELVHGVSITKYCDENQLTTRERLELFVPVCQAIQHAHQKGIIHRDVKPTNVMITLHDGKPVPKVIDFGVAKAIEQKLTERTLFTQYGTVVGTLEYMSPEQAEMSAQGVDTRSDIYSLGVILYELLTGTTPHDSEVLAKKGYDEMRRVIREDEPPRPSARLSTLEKTALTSVCDRRRVEPRKLGQQLRGELDWIVMKALEKDRNRRYEAASAFAVDVMCYLTDQPVEACPPSLLYRFAKFFRRNKVILTTAALVALTLSVLVGSAGWLLRDRMARDMETARVRQAQEEVTLQAVKVELDQADKLQTIGKLREALAAAKQAAAILAGGAGTPVLEQQVQRRLADLNLVIDLQELRDRRFDNIDFNFDQQTNLDYAQAFRVFGIDLDALSPEDAARRIREGSVAVELAAALDGWYVMARREPLPGGKGAVVPPDRGRPKQLLTIARLADPDLLRTKLRLAVEVQDTLGLHALLAEIKVEELPPTTASFLANALSQLAPQGEGDLKKARQVLYRAQHRHPYDPWLNWELAFTISFDVIAFEGDFNDPRSIVEALPYMRAVLAVRPNSARVHYAIGLYSEVLGQWDQSIGSLREAIRLSPAEPVYPKQLARVHINKALLDKARPARDLAETVNSLSIRANVAKRNGQIQEFCSVLEEVYKTNETKLGPDHLDTIKSLHALAMARRDAGQINAQELCSMMEQIFIRTEKTLGPDHKDTLKSLQALAPARRDAGLMKESVAAFEEIARRRKAKAPEDPDTWNSMMELAFAYLHPGRFDEAVPLVKEVLELRRAKFGADNPQTLQAMHQLGNAYYQAGRLGDAISMLEEVLKLRKATLGPNHNDTFGTLNTLGMAYRRAGRVAEAKAIFEETLLHNKIKRGPDNGATLQSMRNLSLVLMMQGQYADAEPLLRECLVRAEKTAPDAWPTFHDSVLLGRSLLGQQKYAEAEALLIHGYAGIKLREAKIAAFNKVLVIEMLESVVDLYEAAGKANETAKWRNELEGAKARANFIRE